MGVPPPSPNAHVPMPAGVLELQEEALIYAQVLGARLDALQPNAAAVPIMAPPHLAVQQLDFWLVLECLT